MAVPAAATAVLPLRADKWNGRRDCDDEYGWGSYHCCHVFFAANTDVPLSAATITTTQKNIVTYIVVIKLPQF